MGFGETRSRRQIEEVFKMFLENIYYENILYRFQVLGIKNKLSFNSIFYDLFEVPYYWKQEDSVLPSEMEQLQQITKCAPAIHNLRLHFQNIMQQSSFFYWGNRIKTACCSPHLQDFVGNLAFFLLIYCLSVLHSLAIH